MHSHNQDPEVREALQEIHGVIYSVNWRSITPEGKPDFFKDAALSLVKLVGGIKDKLSSDERRALSEEMELQTLKNHPDEHLRTAFALCLGTLYSVDLPGSVVTLELPDRCSLLWDYLTDPSPRVKGSSIYALDGIVSNDIRKVPITNSNVLRVCDLLDDESPKVQIYAADLFTTIYSRYPGYLKLPDCFSCDMLDGTAMKILELPITDDYIMDIPQLFSISKLLINPNHMSLSEVCDKPDSEIPFRGISKDTKKAALDRLTDYSMVTDPEVYLRAKKLIATLAEDMTLRPMLWELALSGSCEEKKRALSSILSTADAEAGKPRLRDDIVLTPPAAFLSCGQPPKRRPPETPRKLTN